MSEQQTTILVKKTALGEMLTIFKSVAGGYAEFKKINGTENYCGTVKEDLLKYRLDELAAQGWAW